MRADGRGPLQVMFAVWPTGGMLNPLHKQESKIEQMQRRHCIQSIQDSLPIPGPTGHRNKEAP